ncbi:Ferredoxin subunit of nitrite reductase or a ring-hydroxylating dioxygenase [Amycolatopsis xylanica]|uniref:Ferredoxin subunit of nitrite reductase or a ring-hydroxylating dioxygenase n=1 Tax=Amycolatopsis xylanica TaxID=589385 RepID=A0A1H2TDJ8_9PSEU|nr:Rieske (2Fe-2S) protein [Amycolatopsis xylanica]SDW41775.1 Ferredoxin subunit of nitrite reductase or a ring-hydroxylating dioxygenase [Amycolatopsis xylanica]
MRGLRRYVKDLLRGRRPRPFAADAAEEAEARAAILLRAAGPDRGPASGDFVEDVRRRLASELDEAGEAPRGGSRRRFVEVTSVAAASVALGIGLDRVLTGDGEPSAPAAETVVPDGGEWRAVVAAKDLPEGAVVPFDAGAVSGFVERAGGQVRAVSGACTHLGCKLTLNAPARQLDCPCHKAAFAVDGAVLHHRLPIALPPLPRLLVRESGGVVEVFVPTRTA